MGRRKYSSKKVIDEVFGEFDSQTEYLYFIELKNKERMGEISDLKRQEEFLLVPSFKDNYGKTIRKMVYISDYTFLDNEGKKHIIDVKGSLYNETNEFKVKMKMCKYLNPDLIFEVIVKIKNKWYNLENPQEKKQYALDYKERKYNKKNK